MWISSQAADNNATLEQLSFRPRNHTIPCHVAGVLTQLGSCGCVKLTRLRGGSDHATAAGGVAMNKHWYNTNEGEE